MEREKKLKIIFVTLLEIINGDNSYHSNINANVSLDIVLILRLFVIPGYIMVYANDENRRNSLPILMDEVSF